MKIKKNASDIIIYLFSFLLIFLIAIKSVVAQQKANFTNYQNSDTFYLGNVNGKNYLTPVKDQRYSSGIDSNMCWAFSTNSVLESVYLIEGGKTLDLSEKHIAYGVTRKIGNYINPHGFYIHQIDSTGKDSGGNVEFSGSYLAQRRGPVLETKFPFEKTISTLNELNITPDYTVKNIYYYKNNNSCNSVDTINKIKSIMVKYGPIATLIKSDVNEYGSLCNNQNGNKYLPCSSYYYNGSEDYTIGTNHGVTIVGWDDNYSKNNFSQSTSGTPTSNGAWIVKDNYQDYFRTNYGNGIFYVSYEDSLICKTLLYVEGIEKAQNYNLYTYSNLANSGYATIDINKVYFKQKFKKKSTKTEILKEIELYTQAGDAYKIYYSTEDNFSKAQEIASGSSTDTGYTTIEVDNKTISSEYYIYIEYTSNNKNNANLYMYPFAAYNTNISNPDMNTVEEENIPKEVSYYSSNPNGGWTDSSTENGIYPMVYVFTDSNENNKDEDTDEDKDKNYNLVAESPIASNNKVTAGNGYYYIPLSLENISLSDIEVKIFDKEENNVTNEFIITEYQKGFKISSEISNPGEFNVIFTYNNLSSSKKITIYSLNNNSNIPNESSDDNPDTGSPFVTLVILSMIITLYFGYRFYNNQIGELK